MNEPIDLSEARKSRKPEPASERIDLEGPITELAARLGFDKKNLKRITLESGRAVVLAFDINEDGSKYVQIGTSNQAALFEQTFEIVS